jgi:hypothetical protein
MTKGNFYEKSQDYKTKKSAFYSYVKIWHKNFDYNKKILVYFLYTQKKKKKKKIQNKKWSYWQSI